MFDEKIPVPSTCEAPDRQTHMMKKMKMKKEEITIFYYTTEDKERRREKKKVDGERKQKVKLC